MGTDGGLNVMGKNINNKGVVVIYVAIGIIVLIAFVGLAVDIGYMYVVKGQLQNAADAAALAGAAKLDGTTSIPQTAARTEAVTFAAHNKAAGASVTIDPNITNNSNGDVVVGNWDPGTRQFTVPGDPGFPTPGILNAVKVVARRTGETDTGIAPNTQVSIFFGKIFSLLPSGGVGWPTMSAKSQAIAAGSLSTGSILLCVQACGGPDKTVTTFAPPRLYYWTPMPAEVNPGSQGIAWTIFSETDQNINKDLAESFFCGNIMNACGKRIYSHNGNASDLARQFRCAFKNPNYKSADKTCSDDPQGKCGPGAGNNVTSWKVIVPIVENAGCPPGAQPLPYLVVKYARIRIIEVYSSGGGGKNKCACGAYDAPSLSGDNAILVDQIECQSCSDTDFFTDLAPSLVK